MSPPQPSLTVSPIGFIRCPKQLKFQALHQPNEEHSEQNILELLPGQDFELALRDLEGFSRVWLVWWFHRNASWRPLVLPPRGNATRRGVFATRSPYRPNPIGLSPVQLISIKGRKLTLGPCDLVDGTPVLDIKPYFAPYDAFPEAAGGWIDEVEAAHSDPPEYAVRFSGLAQEQAEWLREEWEIDFRPRMIELLSRDPSLHRSRRIRRRGDSLFLIGCGSWRAVFVVNGKEVEVLSLEAGYPMRCVKNLELEDLPDREAQLAFMIHWKQVAGVSD